jgi:hypothetical protein
MSKEAIGLTAAAAGGVVAFWMSFWLGLFEAR